MRTMAQKRAEYALTKVLAVVKSLQDPDKLKHFKHFSAGAPSMILQNGLGQTLAFWLAKGRFEHQALFSILKDWLKETNAATFGGCQKDADLIGKLSGIDQRAYLSAQNESLALLEWVKRFANADLS